MFTEWFAMQMPSPGALWPAIVMKGLLISMFLEADGARDAKHHDTRSVRLDGGAKTTGAVIIEIGDGDDLPAASADREHPAAPRAGKRRHGIREERRQGRVLRGHRLDKRRLLRKSSACEGEGGNQGKRAGAMYSGKLRGDHASEQDAGGVRSLRKNRPSPANTGLSLHGWKQCHRLLLALRASALTPSSFPQPCALLPP